MWPKLRLSKGKKNYYTEIQKRDYYTGQLSGEDRKRYPYLNIDKDQDV